MDTQLHTEATLEEYFTLESHLLSTRTADGYKALDKTRGGKPIFLWMLRHPLVANSDAVRRFLTRMHAMDEIDPAVTDMTAFGVDAEGRAFSIFDPLDGYPMSQGNVEASEAERRFISALRYIKSLHEKGIACGDLCGESFWVSREGGGVTFIGVMGSFDSEAAATAMAPPAATMPYLAPEQRAGGGLEPASDVFALGVLGYFLLTGRFPYQQDNPLIPSPLDISKVPSLSNFLAVPPIWGETVLRKAIAPNASERYQNASEMLDAITEVRERAYSDESVPAKTSRSVSKRASSDPEVRKFEAPVPVVEEPETAGVLASKRLQIVLLMCLIVGVLVFGLAPDLFRGKKKTPTGPSRLEQELARKKEFVTDPSIEQAIDVLTEKEVALSEKRKELEKFVSSDDPVAHEILVKSCSEADSEGFRKLSENATLERARRLGLMRSSEQVRQWLRTVKGNQLPEGYETILRLLNVSLPSDDRSKLLRQAYVDQPLQTLRLVAALSLDTGEAEEFQPIVAQLIGDSQQLENAGDYSTLALILSDPDLTLVFGEDVIQQRENIRDEDILWLLEKLSDRNDVNVRAIANLALQRNLLPEVKQSFLKAVRDRGDMPSDVSNALIKAAAGTLQAEDLQSFGRWYDVQAEQVLLSIAADKGFRQDEDLMRETFDMLAGKSLLTEPSASLVTWVRSNYWEQRGEFSHIIGVLANIAVLPEDEVKLAFSTFDEFVRDGDLIDVLLSSNEPLITKTVVEEYTELLSMGALIELLENASKAVRMAAVRALAGTNDIGALKLVIDAYRREKDPEVRALYKESFWVIQKREGGE